VRRRYQPPGDQPRQAQFHAEEQLLNLLKDQIDELGLKPRDLEGRTVRIAVDQEVCSVCASGTGSEGARSGVILQFAEAHKALTIEIVDIRSGHYLRFERGRLAVSHRGMGESS
jgi:hypothetical protein